MLSEKYRQIQEAYDKAHENPDTDNEATSIHHTLGEGPTQAAKGNHDHDADYAPLDASSVDWTTFSPTLISFTQSAGLCQYMVSRKRVTVHGSHTVSAVTGDMVVSLPFTAVSGFGSLAVGAWQAIDVGGVRWGGTVALNGTGNIYFIVNGGTFVKAASPFTWGAGDILTYTYNYRMA